jgi:hypothetical protein
MKKKQKYVLIEEVTFCDKLLEKDWIPLKYMPTLLRAQILQ